MVLTCAWVGLANCMDCAKSLIFRWWFFRLLFSFLLLSCQEH